MRTYEIKIYLSTGVHTEKITAKNETQAYYDGLAIAYKLSNYGNGPYLSHITCKHIPKNKTA